MLEDGSDDATTGLPCGVLLGFDISERMTVETMCSHCHRQTNETVAIARVK
jgi:hypothetical protein